MKLYRCDLCGELSRERPGGVAVRVKLKEEYKEFDIEADTIVRVRSTNRATLRMREGHLCLKCLARVLTQAANST